MDVCDDARTAEIEKAVVEQAHCYLPPREKSQGYFTENPMTYHLMEAPRYLFGNTRHEYIVEEASFWGLLVMVALLASLGGFLWGWRVRDEAHKKLPRNSSQRRSSR